MNALVHAATLCHPWCMKPYQAYDNPRKARISTASRGMRIAHLTTRYSLRFFEKRKEMDGKLLSQKLAGKVLVDVGCGTFNNEMVRFARGFGVATYVGVDISAEDGARNCGKIRVLEKCGDMLEFVSRLPPESVNFLINGIDFLGCNPEYLALMVGELTRATPIGGIIFGRGSEPIEWKLDKSRKFRKRPDVFRYGYESDSFLFEKTG